MTCSDTTMRQGSAGFRNSGTGHVSGWRCGCCLKPQYRQLGRKLRRVQGLKTWVCAGCAVARAPK